MMDNKEMIENVKYIVFGVITAYLLNFGLGIALGTDLPVVAVVSGSMTHDYTTSVNHYQYLETMYGFTKEQIDSWPINQGFMKGDVLVIKGVDRENLKVGDVIVFNIKQQSDPIVHRIVKIEDGFIQTKGDHNSIIDPLKTDCSNENGVCWQMSKIHGKAIFLIPFLGWPKLILNCALNTQPFMYCVAMS